MTWVKLDDHFDENPKIAQVGPLGIALWVTGLAYCNRNLTDGFIPWATARKLLSWDYLDPPDDEGRRRIQSISVSCGMVGDDVDSDRVIVLLVMADLWDEVDGGFQVHDFDQYQPTRAQVEAERAQKVAAGQAGGIAAAKARAKAGGKASAQAESKPVPVPDPVPSTSNEVDTAASEDDVPAPVREMRDHILSKLPLKFSRDPETVDEALLFAQDYAGKWRELNEAVAQVKRQTDGKTVPFPGSLRKYMPPLAGAKDEPKRTPLPTWQPMDGPHPDRRPEPGPMRKVAP